MARSRTPAPVAPLVWAVKLTARTVRHRSAQRRDDARQERLVTAVAALAETRDTRTEPPPVTAPDTPDTRDGDPRDTPVSLSRRLRSVAFRRRRDTLAPLAAAAVLALLWAVVHWLGSWAWAGLAAAAVTGAWWASTVDPRGVSTRSRVAAWATVLAGLVWVASPAALPVGPWQVPVVPGLPGVVRWPLLTAWTAVAVAARYRRFRPRPEPAAPPRTPIDVWRDVLSVHGGPVAGNPLLPGTLERVTAPTGEDIGWRAGIYCPPGSRGAPAIRDARDRIATTFHVEPESVEVGGPHAAPWVQIIERGRFTATSQPWQPGGVDDTGRMALATYGDGERAHGQLYRAGYGVFHTFVTGGTGSGKTGVLNGLIGSAMQTGRVMLDLVDLGENSLPAWVPVAHRAGTTVEAGALALRRANALIDSRRRLAADMRWTDGGVERIGRSTLPIDGPWPIYLVVIDEWPELLRDPAAMKDADRLGRLGRKFLVGIVIATQNVSLQDAFRGADGLRKNIQQGNTIGLRADGTAGQMTFGRAMTVNLSQIPIGNPGLGYLCSPATARDTRCRFDWIDEDPGRPAGVPSPWDVADHARPAGYGPGDREAIEQVEADATARTTGTVTAMPTRAGGDLRAAIESAVRAAGDDPVTTGTVVEQVARELGVARTEVYDRVRKGLAAAAEDGQSHIQDAGHGKWTWRAA